MYTELVPWHAPEAEALRAAQRVEIAERYGTPDSEPGVAPTAADIAVFVLARLADGTAVGCGGLRQLDATSAEVKRMYVTPTSRGTGAADAVLDALEAYAAAQGWTHLLLETGDRQPDAVAFYRRRGYERIPNFGSYADSAASLCFARSL
ncbi:GNAT family N-acetyltransferase [Jatrophihabitans sp.]|uniref:GNAT family N-acetyltransferase n=1 Tax=Jatrophihabitans sp. TaxID=1932789 RepID=UPI0030C694FA|nr:family acetyltransferase [Jatrophihabitans sp.]